MVCIIIFLALEAVKMFGFDELWSIIQENMRYGACELPEAIDATRTSSAAAAAAAAGDVQSSSAQSKCRSAQLSALTDTLLAVAALFLLSLQEFHV